MVLYHRCDSATIRKGSADFFPCFPLFLPSILPQISLLYSSVHFFHDNISLGFEYIFRVGFLRSEPPTSIVGGPPSRPRKTCRSSDQATEHLQHNVHGKFRQLAVPDYVYWSQKRSLPSDGHAASHTSVGCANDCSGIRGGCFE